MTTQQPERIAKVIARAGLCSRREAERWITEGRVEVNGTRLTTPAHTVLPSDTILVDGNPLPTPEKPRLWRFHKPTGVITTHHDPKNRPTLFSLLPSDFPRVVSVGRLDLNSEGLILLTTDGTLAGRLAHPDTGFTREYRVRVHGRVDEAALSRLQHGITIQDDSGKPIQYGPITATLERQGSGRNHWLRMILTEGRNREIRRICAHLGLEVNRLIRTAYGPFQLGKLAVGESAEVPYKSIRDL